MDKLSEVIDLGLLLFYYYFVH